MKPNPPDPLDDLLQRWAAASEPSDEHLAALRRRVGSALPSPVPAEIPVAVRSEGSAGRGWPALLGASVALAACVILLVFAPPAWRLGRVDTIERPGGGSVLPPPAWAVPAATELAARSTLFDTISSDFPGQLDWIAETDDDIRLGLSPRPLEDRDRDAPVVVRLLIARRETLNDKWRPVWQLDVVTRPGELVHLPLPQGDVALWIHMLPDGLIAVESEVAVRDLIRSDSAATSIQRPGVPVAVDLRGREGDEYRLYQTVSPRIAG